MAFKPPRTFGRCKCDSAYRWSQFRNSPFLWDEATGEFQIRFENCAIPLYFCHHCGGRLPSRRDELFTTPSRAEMAESRRLLKHVKSIEDVVAALGPADEISPWDDRVDEVDPLIQPSDRWQRAHRYDARWKTLVLIVYERHDGSIDFFWSGKYMGDKR